MTLFYQKDVYCFSIYYACKGLLIDGELSFLNAFNSIFTRAYDIIINKCG